MSRVFVCPLVSPLQRQGRYNSRCAREEMARLPKVPGRDPCGALLQNDQSVAVPENIFQQLRLGSNSERLVTGVVVTSHPRSRVQLVFECRRSPTLWKSRSASSGALLLQCIPRKLHAARVACVRFDRPVWARVPKSKVGRLKATITQNQSFLVFVTLTGGVTEGKCASASVQGDG